ncbi:MAG: MoaD/ThiS family protein [Campylobacterota bacterium]|nr:MoaD/ThiS family protein [Campylobacterota bacterium]
MVTVEFLGPIGKAPMQLDIDNLSQLSTVLKGDEEIISWLENCAVAINDVMICSKDTVLNDGDKISLLPPVCGG